MKHYANQDANGNLAFYNDVVNSTTIPTTAIEITEDQWQDSLANPGKYNIVNGAFAAAAVWPPALTAAQITVQTNASILAKIATLEASQTPRLYREAIAGSTAVNATTGRTAAQELAYIDSEIETLRTQLQK
jgi:hypothetical protein